MTSRPKTIVFTDLDGTLLDSGNRSPEAARPAVERLKQAGIPIVFCSAKTRSEQEAYRRELGIRDPFIVENGGAVFIPRDGFPFEFDCDRAIEGYYVIELGTPYAEIRRILERIRAELGVAFKGFGDLTVEEVAEVTGLAPHEACRAKAREYDETLLLNDLALEQIERILNALEEAGLRWTHGGIYHHAMGANDKGRAAQELIELYGRQFAEIRTIGIGDGLNDLPLLEVVDVPVLVQKPDGSWEDLARSNLERIAGIGPEGWRRALEALVLP